MAVRKKLQRREVKHDTFVEFVYRASDYLLRHVQQVFIIVGVVVVAGGAGYLYSRMRQSRDEEAARLLAPAQIAAQRGQYKEAIPAYERVLREHDGTRSAGEAAIALGNAYFHVGRTDDALKTFQRYLNDHQDEDELLTISAMAGMAACGEQQGKYLDAAKRYQQTAEQFATSFIAPRLLIDAGRCYDAAGQKAQAKQMYDKVVTAYKTSRYVREAKVALAAL
ncbi:MAG: tetratricopeptide repeat protein [Candidatus Latescibacteria bacterium]|nr:tetratricopeptide repeat protein [Candidatus Latescibacterota bacterium]